MKGLVATEQFGVDLGEFLQPLPKRLIMGDALSAVLLLRGSLEEKLQNIARLQTAPTTRIRELTGMLDICERQLRRRFSDAVGYGPKMFARIVRLQQFRTFAVQASQKQMNLAALAFDLGYADQAHMTREIGELSGFSPLHLLSVAAVLQTASHETPLCFREECPFCSIQGCNNN